MSEDGIKVKDSVRKKRRDIKDALGDDILRYIAELLTNSDDSYRRLESKGETIEEAPIYIEVKKDKRDTSRYSVSVTDNAEGMSKETMEKIFGEYGGDNAGGKELHARGIFGQGASDVLRAAAKEKLTACIESVKDDKITKLLYNMEEDLTAIIKFPPVKTQVAEFKKALKISRNGTRITFGIPSTVKFKEKDKETLAEKIAKYPYFRWLLNQENRKVVLICDNKETVLSSEKYQFDEKNFIAEEHFEMPFDGEKLKCILKMYKNENKPLEGTNILVINEDYSVFDNTMFDFQNHPSAQYISGVLLIEGLYEICYKHLNLDDPDAIVRDNRTGFDVKNPFYSELNKIITPYIRTILEQHGKDTSTTDITNNKKFNDALKKLNKYMKEEMKEVIGGGSMTGKEPPAEGFKFARSGITITKGKVYDLKLLINPDIIEQGEIIEISHDGEDYMEVSPNQILYNETDIIDGVVAKSITIKAEENTEADKYIKATLGSRETVVAVEIIEEDVHYPETGMDFYPNEVSLIYNKPHVLNLYIDVQKIPIGSIIYIKAEGLETDEQIELTEEHKINGDVAKIDITLIGGELGQVYEVFAICETEETNAKITLVDSAEHKNQSGGLIAGIKLQASDMAYQSYYSPADRYIYINNANPINVFMMGDMTDKDPDNPTFSKEQRKYLCDVIANQAATLLVKNKNIKNGEIDFNDDVEGVVEIIQEMIQGHKNKMYKAIYEIVQ